MPVRQLNWLLHWAEQHAVAQRKSEDLIKEWGAIEPDPRLYAFLAYLIDPSKDQQDFAAACTEVYTSDLSPFWRALAAHHRGVVAAGPIDIGPADSPDQYFPKALSLINPVWMYSEAEWKADLRKKHQETPEALYIYHSRMRAREELLGVRCSIGATMLGAQAFILQGWFDAPSWTGMACDKLLAANDREQAKKLLKLFTGREQQKDNPCYFSLVQRAELMRVYDGLLAV